MCLPPDRKTVAANEVDGSGAMAASGAPAAKARGRWDLPMPRFNAAHAPYPLDKRLNLLFEFLPGVQLSPLYLLQLPVFLCLAIAYRADFRPRLLGPMFALYLFRECFGMSLSLHRYFSHKGFRCGRGAQFALWWLGCMACQGPPLWWASKHRRHHAKCDTEDDPHTPVCFNPLYAWVGWTYLPGAEGPLGRGVDEEYVGDHMIFPELVYGETFHMVPVFATHAACYALGGAPAVVYVSMLSGMACQLATMYFNVAFHTPEGGGSHEADGECHARDIPWDPLSNIFGEAYHAWHHIHPRAHWRPGVDLPYFLAIKPMLMLGVFQGPNIMHKTKLAVRGFDAKTGEKTDAKKQY